MNLLHYTAFVLSILIAIVSAGHALLWKRDPRAALGWAAVCLIFPFAGPFLYFLFGINRVKTRARKLRENSAFRRGTSLDEPPEGTTSDVMSGSQLPLEWNGLTRISGAVTRRPLLSSNRIEMLQNGEQAYPAMLEAIEAAEHSLFLSTYIFETKMMGRRFINALARAQERGVDVRVIIDGIGEFYSFPRAGDLLKKHKIRIVRFLPPRIIPPSFHINLRTHRKILVADGLVGFVGGMNIGDRHMAGNVENPSRVVDMHFRLAGPVVEQIEQIFLEDWYFITGESSPPSGISKFTEGSTVCRAIVDGPNEDLDKFLMILMGAISYARSRVSIMTPYFLPSQGLISALQAAALRGVEVTVILPIKNNLPFVHWASRKMLWELLQWGVRVFYQPSPFVHTKLFQVDDYYAIIGSANMDPRSFRLNFELVIEIYDKSFARIIMEHVRKCKEGSRELTFEEIESRPLPARLRDALAWVFSPYL
jgi:cardiolipin synthase